MLIFGNVGPFVLNLLPFRNKAKGAQLTNGLLLLLQLLLLRLAHLAKSWTFMHKCYWYWIR